LPADNESAPYDKHDGYQACDDERSAVRYATRQQAGLLLLVLFRRKPSALLESIQAFQLVDIGHPLGPLRNLARIKCPSFPVAPNGGVPQSERRRANYFSLVLALIALAVVLMVVRRVM
jgi:hypothetical protein